MNSVSNGTVAVRGPDVTKRVNYSFGLVLGVDEFVQEQAYFLDKHRLHGRLLHGYGTAVGLPVKVVGTAAAPEIRVGAGLAVNPLGQEICVPSEMCTQLNTWLTANRSDLAK